VWSVRSDFIFINYKASSLQELGEAGEDKISSRHAMKKSICGGGGGGGCRRRHRTFFLVFILLNQRGSLPTRLQVSGCSTFRTVCGLFEVSLFL
jgi:hypothetical protein